jgi:hypothetical protein
MGEASKPTEHVLIIQGGDLWPDSIVDGIRKAYPDVEITSILPESGKTLAESVPKGEKAWTVRIMYQTNAAQRQKSWQKPLLLRQVIDNFLLPQTYPSMYLNFWR